ncbi:sigma-70 family RNA polymerase sigma factor [Intrasporangium sp. DVR]|uniref:sigma-70 family RNA polymerase sigma factor n=1 Tax=Intrasporangium sp. DVR TaxID=3127867 RepID=UPI00313A7104
MAADMSMWSSEAWSSAADMYLLSRSREGSAEAFGELWRRHLPAAYAVAGKYRGRTAAEDIVAEASARVFALIQEGKGPDEHFRAYFLSAVRSVAIDHGRRELKVVPAEDETLEQLGEPVVNNLEGVEQEFDADLIRAAFRGLSERDQRVLWHTTVEGDAPRTLAPVLGMSANAVSASAMRAREALRAQYLDACAERSLPGADSDECRWAIAHLGAHVRGRLPKRQKARVEEHLRTCRHAATVAADLHAIHAEFPSLIVPFVFLAGLGTAGFVNATALAGVTAAAATTGAAGATTGAAGATTGSAGATTGSAAGGVAAAAPLATAAPPTAPPGAGLGDSLSQLAGRATTLVAGVAIAAGLASAAPVPVERAAAAPGPVVTSPAAPAPAPTPSPSTPSPTTPPPATRTPAPTRSVASPPARAPRPTPARSTSPAPPPPRTPETRTPPPSRPPAPAPVGSAAEASVHVVQQRESTRFLLRVRGVDGPVTIVVTTPSGGELTLRNSSWDCASLTAASIRCTGGDGQAMLLQSGLDAPAPIRVTITESSGATRTQTLSLG